MVINHDFPERSRNFASHRSRIPLFGRTTTAAALMIVETFFLVEEKRAMRTQNFQDLF
jgi:hypothetical protein